MNKGVIIDNKAMNQAEKFVKENPNATYQEVAKHISWYFDVFNFSPWICDFILMLINPKMNKRRA